MVASGESRAMRRRYCTGLANAGIESADHANVGVTDASGDVMGVRAVTPVGKTALSATSGRPQPRVLSGCVWLVAKRRKAASSAIGVRPGCTCFTSAADAATTGVANDVALSRRTLPPAFQTQTAAPGAARSCF